MNTNATPVILSWSGGKDSTLALHRLRADPSYRVIGLLTTVTTGYERISIHGVRRSLLHAQAESLGLPLWEADIPPAAGNAVYESAVESTVARIRASHPDVRTYAFGDLFLADIRAYREALCGKLGVHPIFPVWGAPTAALAREFISRGFRAHLVCVDTQVLAASFAGRAFDDALLRDLPPSIDPCGENGEFHTFVSAGPPFARPIAVRVGDIVLRDDRFAYADLLAEPN